MKLFFLLSGEHPTLPMAELEAVLEAERFGFKELERLPQLALLEADEACIGRVVARCAFVKACGLVLLCSEATKDEIAEAAREVDFSQAIQVGESFEVRVKRIRGSSRELDRVELERRLGEVILQSVPGARVDLRRPEKSFTGFLTGGRFVLGLKLAEVPTKPFLNRMPVRRPSFHPTTMVPKLARCMVNLARARPGQVLLDPFCGVGGILIEAGLIGCKVVGFDVRSEMVEGALVNLHYYGIDPLGLGVGDARSIPVRKVETIVTDPPYGRAATTLGSTTEGIVHDFLEDAKSILPKGALLCLSGPKAAKVGELGEGLDYELIEQHYVPVHGSLTREVVVLRR